MNVLKFIITALIITSCNAQQSNNIKRATIPVTNVQLKEINKNKLEGSASNEIQFN